MTWMATTEDTNGKNPDGWQSVRLAEVATVISGQHILESDYNQSGRGIGYLTGPADFGPTKPAITKWTEKPRVFCEPMDVLVTVKGAGVGKVNLSPDVPVAIGRQLMAIRGHQGSIDRMFLFSFLITRFNHFQKSAMGATVPGLSREDLEMLLIPLPPLSEQRRIAGVLREQMAAVEKARAAAQARLEAVKTLPASLLRQVFPQPGQPLPAGWRWVRLGEVCEINPRRNDIIRPDIEPTSFVPMEAVDAEKGMICEVRERPFADVKKGYTYFEEGDVLFAKITPCMQNGKHAIARNLIEGIGFASTEFHVIRPAKGILAEWIHHFVRQPAVLHDATNHFTGAVGQQRVPDDFLKSLEIPLPPLHEQRRIAGILREQMGSVEQARAAAEEELATINALPAALLRRAFSGEV